MSAELGTNVTLFLQLLMGRTWSLCQVSRLEPGSQGVGVWYPKESGSGTFRVAARLRQGLAVCQQRGPRHRHTQHAAVLTRLVLK